MEVASHSPIDTLIHARWIIPVLPQGCVLENHSLAIQDKKIVAILATDIAKATLNPKQEYYLGQHALIPGLINAHGHAAMTLLRGYADDTELMDWLNNHIWPVERRIVDYDFVYDGTTLAIAEMISTGTTFAADSYFFPSAVASAFLDNKFRCQVCMPVIQFPNAWAKDENEHIRKGLSVHDDYKDEQLINTAFAPHSPYTVTDAAFEKIGCYSDEMHMPIHLHLHETIGEVDDAFRESGKRPIQRIADLGLLSPRMQAVHMTHLTEAEISLIADKGVHVAHCPDSNLKLASGFCPVTELMASNVNVGVGTDSPASNNNLDMLSEIRSAALLAKGVSRRATSVNAIEALAMGTINGARMFGLEDEIGSLEVGKLADFIAVDLSAINFQPVHNPLSQLVYSATGHQVTDVWINGEQLLKRRRLLHVDMPRLIANANQWRDKIQA